MTSPQPDEPTNPPERASPPPPPPRARGKLTVLLRRVGENVKRGWKVYTFVLGVVGAITTGFAKFDTLKKRTDPEQIKHALSRLAAADTSTENWNATLQALLAIANDSNEYRIAAEGLRERLNARVRLAFQDRPAGTPPCSLDAKEVAVNPAVIRDAIHALARLSNAAQLPVQLDSVDLRGVVLEGLQVDALHMRSSCLYQARFPGLRARLLDFSLSGLDSADLSGAVIGFGKFRHVYARDVMLSSAVIDSADFSEARLQDAALEYGSFPLSEFQNAVLDGANFDHACFYGSSFGGASLARVSLWDSSVVYERAYLGNLKGSVPAGFKRHVRVAGGLTDVLPAPQQDSLRHLAARTYAQAPPRPVCKTSADANG